jgi:hypothetical protein
MKKLSFLLLGLVFAANCFAQKNYMPGYIINLQGDTVNGFINYRNWKTCPDQIGFITALESAETVYHPSELKGFSTAGRIYESAVVQIETSRINKNYLEYGAAFKFRTDTVFLQARFRGAKSLYLYIDNDRRDYFYVLEDTSFTLLEYKRYLEKTDDNSQIFLHENNKYIGQLTMYLQQCPSLKPKIDVTGYYTGSIEKLFREYSKCTGEKYVFTRKNGERRTEFGLFAGTSLTWTSLNGNLDKYLESVDMGLSTNFSFGMLFDFFKFAKAQKWSWSNEFLVTSFKYEGTLYEYTDENNSTTSTTTLNGGYLKWHTLARYKIPVGKFTFYAEAGPSIGVGGLGTNEINMAINFYGQPRHKEQVAIEDIKKFEFGLTGGGGVRLKRFTLTSRYEFGTGFVDNADLSSSSNRIYIFLGIRL